MNGASGGVNGASIANKLQINAAFVIFVFKPIIIRMKYLVIVAALVVSLLAGCNKSDGPGATMTAKVGSTSWQAVSLIQAREQEISGQKGILITGVGLAGTVVLAVTQLPALNQVYNFGDIQYATYTQHTTGKVYRAKQGKVTFTQATGGTYGGTFEFTGVSDSVQLPMTEGVFANVPTKKY